MGSKVQGRRMHGLAQCWHKVLAQQAAAGAPQRCVEAAKCGPC